MKKNIKNRMLIMVKKIASRSVGRSIPSIIHEPKIPRGLLKKENK